MWPKHWWDVRYNSALGYPLGQWWRLLKQNRFAIDVIYAHRLAFISGLSLLNSLYATLDQTRFGRQIEDTVINHPPIFILGHWRSGTTHLHNLLTLDAAQFAAINTYQTANPFTFLSTERFNTKLIAFALPETRLVDAMPIRFASPQEDELALAMLSLKSPYLGANFPHHREAYLRYLDFVDVPADEIEQWQAAFVYLMKKLTFAHQGKRLILKSPPHTARIKYLLELFPEAKFIYLHRQPETVLQSTRRLFNTVPWYSYLQKPDMATLDDYLLQQYTRLHQAYFAQRHLIPAANLIEVAFRHLEANPTGTIQQIYQQFGLAGFTALCPKLEAYLAGITGYKKNHHPPLPKPLSEQLIARNPRAFSQWGYQPG